MNETRPSPAHRALAALRRVGGARLPHPPGPSSARPFARIAAEQLLSRVAGVVPVAGNSVTLLRDGAENYPAWLAAIAAAQHVVDFENYIISDDATGQRFADALIERAQAGVSVRVLYDWLGSFSTSRRFWRRLRDAGVAVRCFNPPRLDSPLGWLTRNHRKTLRADEIGFVAGLCVGDMWQGTDRAEPWRDTGVCLRGPAVADLAAAFESSWAYAGGPPAATAPDHPPAVAGDIAVRVIGSRPTTMGLYRFDQLVAGIARDTLWLTDAYFVGTTAYVRTLCDAARDGVDVRLLVPGASDLPVAKALSRAGYRPLLEAGCRVFEWNGPMLHAKTAVADGRWARIGSSNLNIASWMGNWELDLAIENAAFAGQLSAMYERDLQDATEIVLDLGRIRAPDRQPALPLRRGSPGRIAAGALGLGSTVSAVITNHRSLGPAEARVTAIGAGLLLLLAIVLVFLPRLLTIPLAIIATWIGVTLLVRAGRSRP